MPVVNLQLFEGRALEQKRRLVKAVIDAILEHADARPDAMHIVVQELPKDNWGRAGVLGSDRLDL
jgi:4-oxalocrotonate tautomerase